MFIINAAVQYFALYVYDAVLCNVLFWIKFFFAILLIACINSR